MLNNEMVVKFESQKSDLVSQANGLEIKSEVDNLKATSLLAVIKKARKTIDETFKPMLDSAKATMNTIKQERGKFIDPLEEAEESLRERMSRFLIAEEKRRAELQKKADAKFQKSAEKAEAKGTPITVAPVIIAPIQTAQGASISKRWFAEVTDLKALCRAVADGHLPIEYVQPNMVVLNKVAVALKEGFVVPGVKSNYTISTTIRGNE